MAELTESAIPADPAAEQAGDGARLRWALFSASVAVSMFVAVIAGRASWNGIGHAFGSWHAPAMVDGFVLAITLLRLGFLTRGWQLPLSTVASGSGLTATGYFNYVEAVRSHAATAYEVEAITAPLVYFILAEYLALSLKLRLRLRVQAKARISLLVWAASPIVTTKAMLHMARTGEADPSHARTTVVRAQRARSELKIICPSPPGVRAGAAARRARRAAVHAIRDGVLTAGQIVALLPPEAGNIDPTELLRQINRAAVSSTPRPRRSGKSAEANGGAEPEESGGGAGGGPREPAGESIKSRLFVVADQEADADPSHPLLSPDPLVRNRAVRTLLNRLDVKVTDQTVRKYAAQWADRRSRQNGSP